MVSFPVAEDFPGKPSIVKLLE
jgi:hypothetical protein